MREGAVISRTETAVPLPCGCRQLKRTVAKFDLDGDHLVLPHPSYGDLPVRARIEDTVELLANIGCRHVHTQPEEL